METYSEKYELEDIQNRIKKKMKDIDRFRHTVGVRYTCAALAMAHGGDIEKAELAGILHDCVKAYSDKKMIRRSRDFNLPISEIEEQRPYLLHGRLGAVTAARKYNIKDEEVLCAIACHTTGKPQMSLLDKILFVADYIEPRRNKAKNLTAIRKLAFQDLDKAVYTILSDILDYLKSKNAAIDPMSQRAYTYYKERIDSRGTQKIAPQND